MTDWQFYGLLIIATLILSSIVLDLIDRRAGR